MIDKLINKNKINKKAFSLVELMVALIAMACIMGAIAPVVTAKLKTSRIKATIKSVSSITTDCSGTFGSNCLLCDGTTKCYSCSLTCDDGYYKDTDSCSCKSCTISNCASCSSSSTCTGCNSGYYLSSGSCVSCPAGYSCDGSSTKTPCSKGTYSSTKASSCTDCSSGYYANTTASSSCTLCSSKTSNCSTCNSTTGTCTKCASGYYLSSGSCVSCPAGYYCDGTSTKTACNSGYYATGGKSSCTVCPTISNCLSCSSETGLCAQCNSGYYINSSGKCSSCTAGYSCDGTSTKTQCSAGYYATSGSSSCTKCSAGTYASSTGSSSCTACPAGTYANSGSSSCTSCATGYYSTSGSSSCIACPAGTYANSTGSSSCTACASGYYSTTTGKTSACTSKCSSKTSNCSTCEASTGTCTACDDGYELSDGSCVEEEWCSPANGLVNIGSLCVTQYNIGDYAYSDDGNYIPSEADVTMITATGSDGSASAHTNCSVNYCWNGTTSSSCTAASSAPGGYGGCTRTICNYCAAKAICANLTYKNASAGDWRLPTYSELGDFFNYSSSNSTGSYVSLGNEGLMLCDYSSGNSSAQCHSAYRCPNSYDKYCYPSYVWSSTANGSQYRSRDLISDEWIACSNSYPGTTRSVRCVRDL